jgi:hypothetical protein
VIQNPKRRWYQFNLQTLLFAMAVLAVVFGRVAYVDRMARYHQREAHKYLKVSTLLESLDQRGTKLVDEGERHIRLEERYRRAAWLPWRFVDEETDIGEFTFPDCTISDNDIIWLASQTQLVELDLSGTQVTDAGIAHLSRLTNLTDLWLKNTHVTDAGVRQLQKALPTVEIHR